MQRSTSSIVEWWPIWTDRPRLPRVLAVLFQMVSADPGFSCFSVEFGSSDVYIFLVESVPLGLELHAWYSLCHSWSAGDRRKKESLRAHQRGTMGLQRVNVLRNVHCRRHSACVSLRSGGCVFSCHLLSSVFVLTEVFIQTGFTKESLVGTGRWLRR